MKIEKININTPSMIGNLNTPKKENAKLNGQNQELSNLCYKPLSFGDDVYPALTS